MKTLAINMNNDTSPIVDFNLLLQDLMSQIVDRDRQAFSSLYNHSSDRVYTLALKLLRNHSLAEEVVQETYLQIWQNAENYDPTKGKAMTWLLTLCHRRSVDKIRQEEARKRQEEKFSGDDGLNVTSDDFSDGIANRMEATMIHTNLEKLSPKQNEILNLVYFESKTITEAAQYLDIPVPTAKTRLRDGLNKLRKDLGVK